jgi:hypothetical protein
MEDYSTGKSLLSEHNSVNIYNQIEIETSNPKQRELANPEGYFKCFY